MVDFDAILSKVSHVIVIVIYRAVGIIEAIFLLENHNSFVHFECAKQQLFNVNFRVILLLFSKAPFHCMKHV